MKKKKKKNLKFKNYPHVTALVPLFKSKRSIFENYSETSTTLLNHNCYPEPLGIGVTYFDTGDVSLPVTPSSSPMPRPALPAANLLYNGASSYSSPYSTLVRTPSSGKGASYRDPVLNLVFVVIFISQDQ